MNNKQDDAFVEDIKYDMDIEDMSVEDLLRNGCKINFVKKGIIMGMDGYFLSIQKNKVVQSLRFIDNWIQDLLVLHSKHIEKETVGKINELSPVPYDLASGRVEERDWNGYKQAIDDIISLITKD